MALFFERWGEGFPFLFLHGLLGSGDNWRTIARELNCLARYYLVDLRNHGRSPHLEPHTIEAMAEDVLALLSKEEGRPAMILGHSMGGKVGMYLAMHAPQWVKALIVADMAPKAYPGGHEVIFSALEAVDLQVESRQAVERQLAAFIEEPAIRQFLLKGLIREADGRFRWRWNLPVLVRDYPNMLAAVTGPPYLGPTLFIKGSLSPYIQPQDWSLIEASFPRAELVFIPNAGHWVHVDNPQAVLGEIRRFCQKVTFAG